ncbi:MAG TPA: hypothetical protein VM532_13475 [Burkholderiales bacterium]|nr:hypothetical protein [Burkholderiales bacterium]
MKKILTIIEVAGVIVAIIFGALWIDDPAGPFESIAFMATLIGTTITDMIRRRLVLAHTVDEINTANATFILTVVESINTRLNDVVGRLDIPTRELLRKEILDPLPNVIRGAIDQWLRTAGGVSAVNKDEIDRITQHIEKTAAEAYGVDTLGAPIANMSLADAKPWRFKSLEEGKTASGQ